MVKLTKKRIDQLIKLKQAGISNINIAKTMSLDPKTVRKYVKELNSSKEAINESIGNEKINNNNKKAGGSSGDKPKPKNKPEVNKFESSNGNEDNNPPGGESERKINFVGGINEMSKENNKEADDEYLCPNCGATFKGRKDNCPSCGIDIECD